MTEERLYTQQSIGSLLGTSRQYIARLADQQSWPYQEVPVRGGRQRAYPLATLPTPIRQRLEQAEAIQRHREESAATLAEMARIEAAQRAAQAEAAQRKALSQLETEAQDAVLAREARLLDGRRRFAALPKDSKQRLQAEAKYWILSEFWEFQQSLCPTPGARNRGAAQLAFAARVIADFGKLPEHVKPWIPTLGGKPRLSEGSLQRWGDDYARDGKWGLVRAQSEQSRSRIARHPELCRLVLGAVVRQPQISARRILEFLQAARPDLAALIQERTIHRFLKDWKADNPQVWTYVTHPDQWKNIYMAAAGAANERVTRLNQLWELDSTPGDWLLKDGRHSVIGAVDVYSRRLQFRVSKTSTAAAVSQLLRSCILDWGVPERVRTDNGADYVSEALDGLLLALDVEHQICIPFASEEKPFIERAMRTLSHGLLELLPGFIGHSVADRKIIEARKSFAERVMKRGEVVEVGLSAAELQGLLNDWAEQVYAKDPHAGLDGQTPWAVANAWTTPIRRIHNERALDELLAEIGGQRVVGKKGIRLSHRWFIDPTGKLYEHVGESVTLRLDDQDLGRVAVYLRGAFLCWAVDPDAVGLDRQEAATAIKAHQKKVVAEQAKELRAMARELKQDIVRTVIDYRKSQAENVHELPKRSEAYSTPALEAAAEAARARADADPWEEAPVAASVTRLPRRGVALLTQTPEQHQAQQDAERLLAEDAAQADERAIAEATRLGGGEGDVAREALWREFERRQARGEELSARCLAFMARHEGSDYYRLRRELEAEFYGVG